MLSLQCWSPNVTSPLWLSHTDPFSLAMGKTTAIAVHASGLCSVQKEDWRFLGILARCPHCDLQKHCIQGREMQVFRRHSNTLIFDKWNLYKYVILLAKHKDLVSFETPILRQLEPSPTRLRAQLWGANKLERQSNIVVFSLTLRLSHLGLFHVVFA